MKNFDWTTFTKRIAVKATLSDIYNGWTKASEIEKWFLKEAEYFDSDNVRIDKSSRVESGSSYTWSWYLYNEVESGKIINVNGKDFMQFTFAGECLVDIQLTQQNEYVIVSLTQKNIPTDDESKQGIRLGCESGWSFFLLNLKSYYENGIDLRNKDSDFKGMLNN